VKSILASFEDRLVNSRIKHMAQRTFSIDISVSKRNQITTKTCFHIIPEPGSGLSETSVLFIGEPTAETPLLHTIYAKNIYIYKKKRYEKLKSTLIFL